MIVGKVMGNIWATRKDENLTGLTFLLVEPGIQVEKLTNKPLVVADSLGAGIGDTVLVTSGSTASSFEGRESLPIDARVVAIVDEIE